MELIDPQSGESFKCAAAVPSGKARITFAKRAADLKLSDREQRQAELVFKFGSQDSIKAAIASGEIDVKEFISEDTTDSIEFIEARAKIMYDLFRVSVDQRQMPTEWKARISNDDFMAEQNIVEVEAFVASFRRSLGI